MSKWSNDDELDTFTHEAPRRIEYHFSVADGHPAFNITLPANWLREGSVLKVRAIGDLPSGSTPTVRFINPSDDN